MNERIKELYEQAHILYGIPYEGSVVDSTIVSTYQRKQFDPEKFAELIIKDCIDNVKVWEKDSRNHISYMLKRQYGVEE